MSTRESQGTEMVGASIMEAPSFVLSGVSKSYGSNTVLDGVSFTIPQGQRAAIIGPSGSGKTTLLRLLAGVIWPTQGSVVSLGEDTRALNGRSLQKLRSRIGLIYQSDNLIQPLRVVHNVLMGRLGAWHLPKAALSLFFPQEIERARAALREVELEHKLWSLPGTLSGGEQQRVAIARLLVQEPPVMLADEPSASLDIRLGREVVTMLAGISRRRRSTLVVSLHTLDLLNEGFERVIAMRAGKVIWDGTPAGLSKNLLREVYGAEYEALHLDGVLMKTGA